MVFDIDNFKDVNDRLGHLAGDTVLAEAAARVREVVRSADIPCRIGGDEFAVVLPESSIEQADQLFIRIQNAISGEPIGQAGRLKVSAGVAELQAEDDSISLFERADEALYRAKEAGKGRSMAAENRPRKPLRRAAALHHHQQLRPRRRDVRLRHRAKLGRHAGICRWGWRVARLELPVVDPERPARRT